MHNYQQQYNCFPPAFIPDKNGKPMHSWRVLILPYLEEEDLYAQYRFNEPWDSPHNKALAAQMPGSIVVRASGSAGTKTSYAMLVGPHAISDGPTGRAVRDIKDGLSNTIMVVEAADADINWMEPRDIDAEKMRFHTSSGRKRTPRHGSEISSHHSGGANVLSATDRCSSFPRRSTRRSLRP